MGKQRREHEDLEIAVPNSRFDEFFSALDGLEFFVATGPGEATPSSSLVDQPEGTHQSWGREPAKGLWRLDVFREPSDGDTWSCRRDASIRMPYDRVMEWTDHGVPYGRAEVILLFKAEHADRERNQGDFAAVLPFLVPSRRRWLVEALEVVHPGGHPLLAELGVATARGSTTGVTST